MYKVVTANFLWMWVLGAVLASAQPNQPPFAADDAVSTARDTAVTLDVTANDADPDGDPLVLAQSNPILKAPDHGAAVKVSATSIRYTPERNFTGTDVFRYRVTDGQGGVASATVTVEVAAGEDLLAFPDIATTNENQAVTINVTANDFSTVGNEAIRVTSITRAPSNGTAVKFSSTDITYTPDPQFSGTDIFEYEISDGIDLRARAEVIVTVLEVVNNPPTARDDTASTDEDVAVTINVIANDSDPDGDAIQVADSNTFPQQPVNGTAVKVNASTIRYTPHANFAGTETFTYRITDGNSAFDTATVRVTVTEVNDPPVARDDSASTAEGQAVTIEVTANDTDVDGDQVRLPANPFVTLPSNGLVVRASGSTVTYTPNQGFSGTDSFEYEVTDDRGGRHTAVVTVTVSPVDNNPPVAVDDVASTDEDVAVTIDVIANDSDPDGDAVRVADANTFPQPPVNGTAMRVDNSSIRYTPGANFAGTETFTYRVTDGNSVFDTATVTVTVTEVNDPPVASDDTASTVEGQAVMIDVTANDSDLDGDPIRLLASPFVALPSNGTVVRSSGSTVTYTPNPGFSGTDSFEYEVTDDRGGFDTALVTVTVGGGGNTPPTAVDDTASTSFEAPISINVTANDSDPDGDPVTLTASPIVIAPSNGTAVRISASSIRYTPALGFSGTDSFRYEITDGQEGFAFATVTITVTGGGNNPPTARDDTSSTEQGIAVTIEVTANDSDPDGDSVSLTPNPIVAPPAKGTAVRVNATSVLYTPGSDVSGTDTFRYEITDGRGGTASAAVTVFFLQPNSPPTAVDDTATTDEDTEILIPVTANDSDPDNDALILTSILSEPANGTAVLASPTVIRYAPAAEFSGSDSFSYQIIDGRGGSDSALVTVTVLPVNDPPTAVDDQVETHINTPVAIEVTDNDSDPDVEIVRLTAQGVVTPPSNGTAVRISTTSIEYTPGDRFEGIDTFEYEIEDEGGLTGRALVTVAVTNNPPVAVADAVTTVKNTPVTINVVANDSDPDGDLVKLVADNQAIIIFPSNGTVQQLGAKKIRYTPEQGFLGEDEFVYQVDDGFGLLATATVRVDVVATPPPAITSANPTKITQGRMSTVQLTGSGFSGASVFIGTEKFDPDHDDRVFPFVTDVNIASDGRHMTVKIDATAPEIDGFYNLMVENAVNAIGQEIRVVPKNRPVVDLYSPSEGVPGAGFVLMITGANLRNAKVSTTHPAVSVFDLDNSDDETLTGILSVRPGANVGQFNLIVRRNGEQVSLPAQVVTGGSLTKTSTNLSEKANAKARRAGRPGRQLPAIYLQEFSFFFQGEEPGEAGVIPSQRELEELVRKGVISEKGLGCFGCTCTISRGSSVFRVYTVPLDIFGAIDRGLLDGLRLRFGNPAALDLLTFTFFANIEIRLSFDICRFSDFRFCVSGSVGLEIPRVGAELFGVGGIVHQFSCCRPFGGCFQFPDIETQGSIDQFDLRGNRCSQVTEPLSPKPFEGRHFAEVELVDCCSEDLRLRMVGNAFGLVDYSVDSNYIQVEPASDEPACVCGGRVEVSDKKLLPEDSDKPLTATIENTSDQACRYNWETKIDGSPTVSISPSSGEVTLNPGVKKDLGLKISVPRNTPARDEAKITLSVKSTLAAGGGSPQEAQIDAYVCIIPWNEGSNFESFPSTSEDLGLFSALLGPVDADFSSRKVHEGEGVQWFDFYDECWSPSVPVVFKFTHENILAGRVHGWDVGTDPNGQGTNWYGFDLIGARTNLDALYRGLHPDGCEMGAKQKMFIECPESTNVKNVHYATNEIKINVLPEFSSTTICRGVRQPRGPECSPAH